ncbi:MAG TPA: nitroreductase family protein [Streptosporangiaceae bacterium]|nr:nitroreductase family protein [Streptosporangiaceae bacterium]
MLKIAARDGVLRRIVEAASAAPSIHNTQPWRFTVAADDLLEVRADPDRALWVADPRARALYLSCGAALFNVRAAIRMLGLSPLVWPLPHPRFSPMVIAAVQAEPGRPPSFAEREIYEAIWHRHTNRAPFTAEPVPESVQVALEQAASFEFASLRRLTGREAAQVLDLASQASAELAGDIGHQVELQSWIATGSRDDGIPAEALAATPSQEPAPVRSRDLAAAVPSVWRPTESYEQAPQLAVLTTARDEPTDWLRAGQALQRVLLTATVRGLSASFLYQPIELRDMHGAAAPQWPWQENPQMVIRLGYGPPTATSTPRRRLDDVLVRTAGEQSLPRTP